MKQYFTGLVLFLAIIGFSSFTVYAQCDKTKLSPIQCGYFDQGHQDGIKDAQEKRNNDYKRHKGTFDKKFETFYSDGYQVGFNSITPFMRWDKSQRNIYEKGFDNGLDDKRKKISQLPARYEGKYPKNYESFFVKGYNDAYEGRFRQYDTPIDVPQVPPAPTAPVLPTATVSTTPVTNTGVLSWAGKVDETVSIIIRGETVDSVDVSGTGFKEIYKRMNGSLPRRSAEISVRKVEGRGDVSVLQQPNRQNDYTAIVQVIDNKKGLGDYRLEISWIASNIEEPYQTGSVYWGGRVDQMVDVKISGKDVLTIDSAGTGVSGISSNVSGYLARRIGSVNVKKLRGRGNVVVLQQPNWENDFTAVVRINDVEKGSSDYQIEVSW